MSLCERESGQMLQAVKQSLTWMPETFDARFPGFAQFLIVNGAPTFCLRLAPSQNSNVVMFEPTLNLVSRFVSTFGSKRRYHSSRVCVDVAGRNTWQFCWLFFSDVAKTTLRSFRGVRIAFSGKLPRARIVLFVGSYLDQNFLRRSLLSRSRR